VALQPDGLGCGVATIVGAADGEAEGEGAAGEAEGAAGEGEADGAPPLQVVVSRVTEGAASWPAETGERTM
jgi:hypothetical protein